MAEEPEGNSPPQPIVIHASPSTLETEALPILEPSVSDSTPQGGTPQPTPDEPVASPDDGQTNLTNRLAEAIERYETLKSTSDPGNVLIAISFLIMAVSLFIGVSAAIDGLFNGGSGDGAELCCGGLLTGALLGGGGALQSNSYHEEVKKALAEVKALAGIPEKKTTSPVLATGLILCVLGVLFIPFWDLIGLFMLLGGLGTLLIGALTGSTSEKPEDVLVAAKKEVLRQNSP